MVLYYLITLRAHQITHQICLIVVRRMVKNALHFHRKQHIQVHLYQIKLHQYLFFEEIMHYKYLVYLLQLLLLHFLTFNSFLNAAEHNFAAWLENFKNVARSEGVSENTINDTLKNIKFLPKVIEYDRFQPEFYEDTHTYISKRTNNNKVKKGLILYSKEKKLINKIESKFLVEKELLLALMGIETNFGKYLGKMYILSSLAT